MRPAFWRNLVALPALVLTVACSGDKSTGPATAVAASGPNARLCDAIAGIAGAEPAGFASLRGPAIGLTSWSGRVVPAGFRACSVEGNGRYQAEYVCWGENASGDDGAALAPAFERTAQSVDACLGSLGGGHRFQRGQTFQFAGGERILLWRDMAGGPAPGFSLKVEENLSSAGDYSLRLGAVTLR